MTLLGYHFLKHFMQIFSIWCNIQPNGGLSICWHNSIWLHRRIWPSSLKKPKCFFPAHSQIFNIVGSLGDREVAWSASDRQGSNPVSRGQCHVTYLTILTIKTNPQTLCILRALNARTANLSDIMNNEHNEEDLKLINVNTLDSSVTAHSTNMAWYVYISGNCLYI